MLQNNRCRLRNYPPHQPHYPQQPYPHQPYAAVADIWKQWAAPQFTNEMAVRNYMDQIQRAPGGPRIRLLKATMIANEGPCRNFLTSTYGDKWLFHGASEANASNIQFNGIFTGFLRGLVISKNYVFNFYRVFT